MFMCLYISEHLLFQQGPHWPQMSEPSSCQTSAIVQRARVSPPPRPSTSCSVMLTVIESGPAASSPGGARPALLKGGRTPAVSGSPFPTAALRGLGVRREGGALLRTVYPCPLTSCATAGSHLKLVLAVPRGVGGTGAVHIYPPKWGSRGLCIHLLRALLSTLHWSRSMSDYGWHQRRCRGTLVSEAYALIVEARASEPASVCWTW